MKAYLAIIFCKPAESAAYLREVAATAKSCAGANIKRGEGTAAMTTIAFLSDRDEEIIRKAFLALWRAEQYTWVVPLESPLLIGKSIMDWVRKATAKA